MELLCFDMLAHHNFPIYSIMNYDKYVAVFPLLGIDDIQRHSQFIENMLNPQCIFIIHHMEARMYKYYENTNNLGWTGGWG